MATLTLEELRNRVNNRVSTLAYGPAKRHKPSALDAWINDGIEQYEMLLTDYCNTDRLARTTLTTSTSSTESNGFPQNEFVTLPTDYLELHRISIVDGVDRIPLDPYVEMETDEIVGTNIWDPYYPEGSPGRPRRYRLAKYRDSSGNYISIVRLLPAADNTYTLEVIYQPKPPTLTDGSDRYETFPGTTDYIVCSAAMSVAEFEGVYEGKAYQALQARRDECAQILRSRAGKQDRGGVLAMESPRGRRRNMWRRGRV